jgi:hypothetical protein
MRRRSDTFLLLALCAAHTAAATPAAPAPLAAPANAPSPPAAAAAEAHTAPLAAHRVEAPTVASAAPATVGPVAAPAADAGRLAGSWQGVVLLSPAELENEVEARFFPTAGSGGGIEGRLSFTTSGDLDQTVRGLTVAGSRVRFAVMDKNFVISSFDTQLSADGAHLTGTLEEQGEHYALTLHRVAAPEAAPAATPKAEARVPAPADAAALKRLFNQDDKSVRLIAVVSSSCAVCRSGTGILQRYVLDAVKDPRLAVYVIWEPVAGDESATSAALAGRSLTDSRVVQLVARDRFAGRAFAAAAGTNGAPAWDVFLLFGAGTRWGDAAPTPRFLMINMPDLEPAPARPHLNGKILAQKVQEALSAAPPR